MSLPGTSCRRENRAISSQAGLFSGQGLKVGYLSREDARRYRHGLQALEQKHGKPIALAGVIAGGGMRADGPGRLGVFLEHDPADFGLRPMQMSPGRVGDADRAL
jgi:hypothetical protein